MTLEEYQILEAFEGTLEDLRIQLFGLESGLLYWTARRDRYEKLRQASKDRVRRFVFTNVINRCEGTIGQTKRNIGVATNNIEFFSYRLEEYLRK